VILNNKGTTLVELIIYMAITSLIIGGMLELFKVSNYIYQNTIYQAQSTPNANSTLMSISSELQTSSIVSLSNNGQQINYTYPVAPTTRTIYYDSVKKAIIFTQDGAITKTIGIQTIQSLLFVKNNNLYKVTIEYNPSNIATNTIRVTSSIMTGGL
jgi:competence protein ComGC